MRNIKLYIACTLDGYIARTNGDIDWLTDFPNPDKSDYGYIDFLNGIDTVIMGGRTYDSIISMDVKWPYENQKSYIFTRNPRESKENIVFTSDLEMLKNLKNQAGKDIWLIGGGEVNKLFLEGNLIDELIIFCVPIMLGDGIRLFPEGFNQIDWKLEKVQAYKSGIVETVYQK